jgi:hypothetical protein
MAIDWRDISAAHVRQACDLVAARTPTAKAGLVVLSGDRSLPAKAVVREAYRLAKGLGPNAEIKFASGEATLNVLRKLGFRAERMTSPKDSRLQE